MALFITKQIMNDRYEPTTTIELRASDLGQAHKHDKEYGGV